MCRARISWNLRICVCNVVLYSNVVIKLKWNLFIYLSLLNVLFSRSVAWTRRACYPGPIPQRRKCLFSHRLPRPHITRRRVEREVVVVEVNIIPLLGRRIRAGPAAHLQHSVTSTPAVRRQTRSTEAMSVCIYLSRYFLVIYSIILFSYCIFIFFISFLYLLYFIYLFSYCIFFILYFFSYCIFHIVYYPYCIFTHCFIF